jgi:cysteine synthase A
MAILNSVLEAVGGTPLIRLSNLEKAVGSRAVILAKAEGMNPGGSAKDRVALEMILDAERSGKLTKNSTMIEPTSGNTGIGLAAIAASRGYKLIITMPDTMSVERQMLMSAYGAELILTDGKKGMNGAIEEAERIHRETPNSIIASQFDNPANPMAHYTTTGPEIWRDTDGKVDIFVAGVGTGGTLSGVGRFLKEKNPAIRVVAVEPASSPLLSEGRAGAHGLQGIGANFVPRNLDRDVIDEIIPVTEEDAYAAGRALAKTEGILCGITSGAALHAAMCLAKRPENKGKTVVCLLPDTGDRYLSTAYFE